MTATDAEPCRLTFAGRLTVRGIDALHARLREALARHDAVTLDCGDAEAVDVSLIQLLVSAHRGAGGRLRLATPLPEVLREALARGGFLAGDGARHPLWHDGAAAP